jgi:hypothetical protein
VPDATFQLTLEIPWEHLANCAVNGRWRVEPGQIDLLVGTSRRLRDLEVAGFTAAAG